MDCQDNVIGGSVAGQEEEEEIVKAAGGDDDDIGQNGEEATEEDEESPVYLPYQGDIHHHLSVYTWRKSVRNFNNFLVSILQPENAFSYDSRYFSYAMDQLDLMRWRDLGQEETFFDLDDTFHVARMFYLLLFMAEVSKDSFEGDKLETVCEGYLRKLSDTIRAFYGPGHSYFLKVNLLRIYHYPNSPQMARDVLSDLGRSAFVAILVSELLHGELRWSLHEIDPFIKMRYLWAIAVVYLENNQTDEAAKILDDLVPSSESIAIDNKYLLIRPSALSDRVYFQVRVFWMRAVVAEKEKDLFKAADLHANASRLQFEAPTDVLSISLDHRDHLRVMMDNPPIDILLSYLCHDPLPDLPMKFLVFFARYLKLKAERSKRSDPEKVRLLLKKSLDLVHLELSNAIRQVRHNSYPDIIDITYEGMLHTEYVILEISQADLVRQCSHTLLERLLATFKIVQLMRCDYMYDELPDEYVKLLTFLQELTMERELTEEGHAALAKVTEYLFVKKAFFEFGPARTRLDLRPWRHRYYMMTALYHFHRGNLKGYLSDMVRAHDTAYALGKSSDILGQGQRLVSVYKVLKNIRLTDRALVVWVADELDKLDVLRATAMAPQQSLANTAGRNYQEGMEERRETLKALLETSVVTEALTEVQTILESDHPTWYTRETSEEMTSLAFDRLSLK